MRWAFAGDAPPRDSEPPNPALFHGDLPRPVQATQRLLEGLLRHLELSPDLPRIALVVQSQKAVAGFQGRQDGALGVVSALVAAPSGGSRRVLK